MWHRTFLYQFRRNKMPPSSVPCLLLPSCLTYSLRPWIVKQYVPPKRLWNIIWLPQQ
jgi:hypothetical protein